MGGAAMTDDDAILAIEAEASVPPTDPTAALRTALARQVRDDRGWVFLSQATMRLIDAALASQADDPSGPDERDSLIDDAVRCWLAGDTKGLNGAMTEAEATPPPTDPTAALQIACLRTRMPSFAAIRNAITDSYYDTRNEGGTMETAADLAATRVLALASQADDPSGPDVEAAMTDAIEAQGLYHGRYGTTPAGKATAMAVLSCLRHHHGLALRPIIEAAIRAEKP